MAIFLDPTKRKTPFGEYPEVDLPEGWPEPHHIARPRDELGQSIIDHGNKWRGHENLAPSPWDDRTGTINLVDPTEARPERDEMPKYRVRVPAAYIGCNLFLAGSTASFPGWPVDPFNLEAANESAALVLSYQARYGVDRKLAGQPYQSSGRLFFHNPALANSPVAQVFRFSGAAS